MILTKFLFLPHLDLKTISELYCVGLTQEEGCTFMKHCSFINWDGERLKGLGEDQCEL